LRHKRVATCKAVATMPVRVSITVCLFVYIGEQLFKYLLCLCVCAGLAH